MQKITYYTIALIFLTLISSCRKDGYVDTMSTSGPEIEHITFAEAQVNGVVLDARYEPVPDALVEWGGFSAYTDINGAFSLSGAVSSRHAGLTVSKDGFFDAYKVLQTFSDENINTTVSLIERQLSGMISSETGGLIETNQGGKIEFSGGFKNMDGTTYEGDVEVYAFYLHPLRGDFEEMMPGNQMAVNLENERQVLQSYGMLNVELQDVEGNVLQISNPAIITSPVPDEFLNAAPSSIPLWYFDVEDNYWKEDGVATLIDGEYVGEVSHFTWWNCDVPEDFIYLEGSVAPIRETSWDFKVKITILSSGAIGVVSVSDDGSFAGFVPKGEEMLLEIFNLCGELVYSEAIGEYTEDVVLDEIAIDVQVLNWFTLSGQLVDCDFEPVTNGYVSIQYAETSKLIFVNEQGRFASILPDCVNSELVFRAVDLNSLKNTDPRTIDFDSDLDLFQTRVCDDIGGEFSMTLNDVEIVGAPAFVEIVELDSGNLRHDMRFVHVQESGTVIYTLSVKFPSVPDFDNWLTISFGVPEVMDQGNPESLLEFQFEIPNNFTVIENTGVPGSIFHIECDAKAVDSVNNESYNDIKLIIKAIFQ